MSTSAARSRCALVDRHGATVEFASDQLPLKADGKTVDARIVMAPGKRPGALHKVGMHGDDTRYESLYVQEAGCASVPGTRSGSRSRARSRSSARSS